MHVQDPQLAWLLETAYRKGLSRARVIYANGTNAPVSLARRFSFLHILTPQLAKQYQPPVFPSGRLYVIPNFVDTTRFVPGSKAAARAELGLPQDLTIVLCCAAIRRFHKRIDNLVQEFAASGLADHGVMLLVAGAREADTDEIIAQGEALLGDRVRFLVDLPRDTMPRLYQSADSLVLASDHETFGIVLIEAMACGLPIICNDADSFHYVAGPAGLYRDLTQRGAIAAAMTAMFQGDTRSGLAQNARGHVEQHFSVPVVLSQIHQMYLTVISSVAE